MTGISPFAALFGFGMLAFTILGVVALMVGTLFAIGLLIGALLMVLPWWVIIIVALIVAAALVYMRR